MLKDYFLLISFNLAMVIFLHGQPAFPGAQGFGSLASGGRGGEVIYVTNLNAGGPGSLQDALNRQGPRYILFKVSGVINGTVEVLPGNGNFTLAGQTSPGGIIMRGFQSYNESGPSSGNFIIRHIRSRVGNLNEYPSNEWVAEDGITLGGVQKAIIDHCSFGHASDEAVDISRSSDLTIQNCILAETLGGHGYLGGMLINYSDEFSQLDRLSIHHNIWNRIGGRMPEISCETSFCNNKFINLELSDNLFWDPSIETWYEGVTGSGNFYLNMNAVNNFAFTRPTYGNGMFHYDLLIPQENKLYFSGNMMSLYSGFKDYELFYCCNDFNMNNPNSNFGQAVKRASRHPFPVIDHTPVNMISDYMVNNAGAFPRDKMDTRLMSSVDKKEIVNQPVNQAGANDAFLIDSVLAPPSDTDNDGMPDYWENYHHLNPVVQDHNGSGLSTAITGVAGYTNLECYLHCLSEYRINGTSDSTCGINYSVSNTGEQYVKRPNYYPALTSGMISLDYPEAKEADRVIITDLGGMVVKQDKYPSFYRMDLSSLVQGVYILHYFSLDRRPYSQKIVVMQ